MGRQTRRPGTWIPRSPSIIRERCRQLSQLGLILTDHYFWHELPAHIEHSEPYHYSVIIFTLVRTVGQFLYPARLARPLSQRLVVGLTPGRTF